MSNQQQTSKHTPGPWTYLSGREIVVNEAQSTDHDWCLIAEMGHDLPESNSNGRLIAAAPELLVTLKNLVLLCELDGCSRELPEYVAARAAIAKAEGRAS